MEPIRLNIIEDDLVSFGIVCDGRSSDGVVIDEYIPYAYTDLPDYDSKYEVIPTIEGEVLPTNGRAMHKDVTVTPIPYASVSNESGGFTVAIAS